MASAMPNTHRIAAGAVTAPIRRIESVPRLHQYSWLAVSLMQTETSRSVPQRLKPLCLVRSLMIRLKAVSLRERTWVNRAERLSSPEGGKRIIAWQLEVALYFDRTLRIRTGPECSRGRTCYAVQLDSPSAVVVSLRSAPSALRFFFWFTQASGLGCMGWAFDPEIEDTSPEIEDTTGISSLPA